MSYYIPYFWKIKNKTPEQNRKKEQSSRVERAFWAIGVGAFATYMVAQPSLQEETSKNKSDLQSISTEIQSKNIPENAVNLKDLPKMPDTPENRKKCTHVVNVESTNKTTDNNTFCIPKINPENQILLVKQET